MQPEPAEAAAVPSLPDTNNTIKASVCVSVCSGNADVIAGSSSISLKGNAVIIPTPGHNGLLKQQRTE